MRGKLYKLRLFGKVFLHFQQELIAFLFSGRKPDLNIDGMGEGVICEVDAQR